MQQAISIDFFPKE